MRLTQIMCPKCKASLTSKAGIEEGTSIACPKCKQKFDAAAPDEEIAEDFEVVDDEESAAPPKKLSTQRRIADDDEEETPKKMTIRQHDRDDDDERARRKGRSETAGSTSAKRSRSQDEEDGRSRPKKKRRRSEEEDEDLGTFAQLKKNIWLRVSVLGVLLAILGVVSYLLYQKNNKKDDPVTPVQGDDDLANPIRPQPKSANNTGTQTASDQDKFQGSWTAIAATWDGQPYNAQGLLELRFSVKNDRWAFQNQTNVRLTSRCKLDPAKKPAELDLTNNNNEISHGIYRFVDKDTVEICSRKDTGERPKQFDAPKGSSCLYMKLKRDSKSNEPKSKSDMAIAGDTESFRGSWQATAFSISGVTRSAGGALSSMVALAKQPNGIQKIKLMVTDDQWVLEENGEADQCQIDVGKNPAEIDLVHPDGTTSHGIWKQNDKNTLEVLFSSRGDRPKQFGAAPPGGFISFTFSRIP